ncbi:class I SAM-dependent methyltransferase, partial [Planktomarina temperata]|nr:class I SAM-dependent methyltransferase [Planktomarina temperata]
MNNFYFNISLPFYTGSKAGSNNKPALTGCGQHERLKNLPFKLYLDKEYLIPRLHVTNEIETAIKESYANSSMLSTPLGTSSLSNDRLNEVLTTLKIKARDGFINKNFVEIGSGTGHLLFEVKKLGAVVTGFEIGPQAEKYSNEFGIDVINDYFKSSHLDKKVDCI